MAGIGPLRVLPVLGGDLDVADWTRRHRSGLVPDAVPYGLDRMERHGVELTSAPGGWLTSAVGRRARGVVRRAGGGYDWLRAASARPSADVVLSWDERAGVPLALRHGGDLAVVTGVIWTTDALPQTAWVRRAVRAGLARAAAVTVLGSAQGAVLTNDLGVAADRVAEVPFGIDTDFFTPAESDDRPPAHDDGSEHVVAVGNDRDRDWSAALTAFSELRRHRPRSRMTVVSHTIGDAAAGADGVRVVPRLGHDELRTLLRTADAALVLTRPNLHVSGVTAALEAQACGVPVVITGTAGMADYSGDGMVLVPPGDPVGAAGALVSLVEDPSGGRAAGAAARARVAARFSTEAQAVRLAEVVRDAADQR